MQKNSNNSTLRRPRNPMPDNIKTALREHELIDAYNSRPPYQQNDYLGWIGKARTEATRQKRLDQMLSELSGGKKYMNMAWSGGRS